jgi:hypothetical protein
VSFKVADIATEQLLFVKLYVHRDVLLEVEATVKESTAVKASISIFWMQILTMFVEINEICFEIVANFAEEFQVASCVMINHMILKREIAFE